MAKKKKVPGKQLAHRSKSTGPTTQVLTLKQQAYVDYTLANLGDTDVEEKAILAAGHVGKVSKQDKYRMRNNRKIQEALVGGRMDYYNLVGEAIANDALLDAAVNGIGTIRVTAAKAIKDDFKMKASVDSVESLISVLDKEIEGEFTMVVADEVVGPLGISPALRSKMANAALRAIKENEILS